MSDDAKKCPMTHLTTDAGAPVVDNQNSMTAGARGPLLAQDLWLNEKLGNFVREVIPERRMHAKGSGAFGTFTVTNNITQYTQAKLFSEIGKKPIFLYVSQRLLVNVVLRMQNAIFAVSP